VLGLDFPHSEFVAPGLLFLALGIGLIALARFWPSHAPVVAVEALETTPIAAVAELTGAVTAFTREITWPVMIDETATELDSGERHVLIDSLALVAGDWTAPILAAAFDQETDDLRIAALEALSRTTSDVVPATLERAYTSYAVHERYAAIEAAARRRDVPLLERALRDTEGSIALLAAYGLHHAGRHDLIEASLSSRDDARATEIRCILPILTTVDLH
jgi:hypothetical protein